MISKIKIEIKNKKLPDDERIRKEEVYSPKFTLTKINYIHNNPVEAGLVERLEQYFFNSAVDYAGKKGPVKVSILNLYNLYFT